MEKRHNFRELKIWKASMSFVESIYELTRKLPEEERFGLISQMRRSAISIPSNISEGAGRSSNKEFSHFLNIAISSSYELETQMILSTRLYNVQSEELLNELKSIQNMIGGFKRSLS